MQTEILPNNVISTTAETLGDGLLSMGENLGSYIVKSKILSNSGEAEIYLCEKNNQIYVLKYYFNCKPKTEVIEKLKGIKNPNVVTIYEFGEYKGHFYEIIEYAEGGSLDSKNSAGEYKFCPINEEMAIEIVREIISALNECHKVGIIHRDIKPGNLFYKNKDGSNVLIGDFGISSYYDIDEGMSKHLTQTKARTEGYTAPEVYSGIIGPEIDYYSLGVTLWELLTAKNPFLTVEGNPMFPASIILETLQGKMVETLITRSPDLSQKMKTLIRGLMTVRHEKRWNYEQVTKFLNGEDVPVYTETNKIPPIKIGITECYSYKEIAEAILSDLEIGKNFVYRGELGRYLVKIDKDFANQIADEIEEFSAKGNIEEGLFSIAYKLCPNIEFKMSDSVSFSTLSELISILETNTSEIIPYLKDEKKNFYLYLKVIGLDEIGKKILEIVKKSSNDYLISQKIILALSGNSITLFGGWGTDKTVLSSLGDIQTLPEALKKRLLVKVDVYDKNICAWLENQTSVDIGEWRNAISDLYYPEEKTYLSKWELFSLFIDKNYSPIINNTSRENKILATLKFFDGNQNSKIKNLIIDKTWNSFFLEKKYKVCSEILDFISGNVDGLSHDIDFYNAKKGQCFFNLREYKDALLVLENIKGDTEAYKYCALSAYRLNENVKAFNYANKALEQNLRDSYMINLRGISLFHQKRYKEAIAEFTIAIDIKKCKEFYLNRARCYDVLALDGAPELKTKAELDRLNARLVMQDDLAEEIISNEYVLNQIASEIQDLRSGLSTLRNEFSKIKTNEQITPLKTPVAGTLLRYVVLDGAQVRKGDIVIVIESMKMELEIKAPISGIINFKVPLGTHITSSEVIAEIK